MSSLHHAILGVGGVGGLIGACLARSGASVTLVVRPGMLADYPQRLQLESPFGNVNIPVQRAEDVPPCDVLWITVKATQLESALTLVKHPESVKAIVPLLNGIDHIALLRAKYGKDRIIPATIAGETERVAPGHIIHRSPFARLHVASSGHSLLGSMLDEFQKIGFVCRFIEDEPTLMWGKLVFLAPFALATTAADKTSGEILSDPEWSALALGCLREACAVASAEGAQVNADTVITGVMKLPGNMRSSMQKDVNRGSAPELDAIAGPILRGARKHGIPVPATQKLVTAVERRAGLTHSVA